jgi:hypothetical protein
LSTYAAEIEQTQAEYPTCDHSLSVRRQAHRTVDTLIGQVRLKRPYFYYVGCRQGFHPLDASLEASVGRYQLDVQAFTGLRELLLLYAGLVVVEVLALELALSYPLPVEISSRLRCV